MNRSAGNHVLVPVLSRLIPRSSRVPRGIVSVGVRLLALLVVAPLLLGTSAARLGRAEAGAVQVAAPVVSLAALHPSQTYRSVFEVRTHSRAHAPIDAVPLTLDRIALLVASSRCTLATGGLSRPSDVAVTRGYDATAPPAVS